MAVALLRPWMGGGARWPSHWPLGYRARGEVDIGRRPHGMVIHGHWGIVPMGTGQRVE